MTPKHLIKDTGYTMHEKFCDRRKCLWIQLMFEWVLESTGVHVEEHFTWKEWHMWKPSEVRRKRLLCICSCHYRYTYTGSFKTFSSFEKYRKIINWNCCFAGCPHTAYACCKGKQSKMAEFLFYIDESLYGIDRMGRYRHFSLSQNLIGVSEWEKWLK